MQYQSGNSINSSSHCVEAVDRKPGHRRMAVQVDQHVGGKLVQLALAVGRQVERLAQPVVAEIAEQQQPALEIVGEDFGRAEADRDQPFGDRDERPRVLLRRRRVHQHRLMAALANTRK